MLSILQSSYRHLVANGENFHLKQKTVSVKLNSENYDLKDSSNVKIRNMASFIMFVAICCLMCGRGCYMSHNKHPMVGGKACRL